MILLILCPFFGYDAFDLLPGILSLLLGLGMISIGNCFSNNRGYMKAFCRPLSRACHSMFYGRSNSGGGPSTTANPSQAGGGGPVPVRV